MFIFKAKEYQSEKSPIFDSQKSTKTTRKLHIMSQLYAVKVCQLFCNTQYFSKFINLRYLCSFCSQFLILRFFCLLERGLVQNHKWARMHRGWWRMAREEFISGGRGGCEHCFPTGYYFILFILLLYTAHRHFTFHMNR